MQTLPRDIHKGMTVLDSTHRPIGTIDEFRFSENQDFPDTEPADLDMTDKVRESSLIQDIAEVFADDDMPDVLRDRLIREGYIRLDTAGLFAADRYIFPDQISNVTGDEVILNVSKDQLMKH
jgi:hypothetical protein